MTVASMNTELRDHLLFLKGFGDLITNSTTADTGTATYLSITRAASSDTAFQSLVTADTVPRLAVHTSGRLQWGNGSAVSDVSIERSSANNLTLVADSISVGGSFLIFGERVDPGAAATNTARLYVEDNGAGKGRLTVRFGTTAPQVIITET